MRILANENVSLDVLKALRAANCDVASVRELHGGIEDRRVLTWAAEEQRIVLTHDKDYGRLVFAGRLPVLGVILVRFEPVKGRRARRLVDLLLSRDDWVGNFSVIELGRVRMISIAEPESPP
ncbi:MAG TPA: DUF5615 family PIN-like protein [Actinomycetota bacterium]